MSGWDRLQRVTAPAIAALTTADAKTHLVVETVEQDEEIAAMVAAAIGDIDGPRGIGLCLITQTWRLTLDGFCTAIKIPLGPNVAISSVKYVDTAGVLQTLSPAAYQLAAGLDPAVLTPVYGTSWPTARTEPGAVRIEFTAGFGPAVTDVPDDLAAALKLITAERFANREAGGVTPAAAAILDRYRILA